MLYTPFTLKTDTVGQALTVNKNKTGVKRNYATLKSNLISPGKLHTCGTMGVNNGINRTENHFKLYFVPFKEKKGNFKEAMTYLCVYFKAITISMKKMNETNVSLKSVNISSAYLATCFCSPSLAPTMRAKTKRLFLLNHRPFVNISRSQSGIVS